MPLFTASGNDVTAGIAALRTVVIYFYLLALFRLGEKRIMGKSSSFDVVLLILIGAVVSRSINGSAKFESGIAAGLAFIGLHYLMSVASYRSKALSEITKGAPVLVIRDGERIGENLAANHISEGDLAEQLRLSGVSSASEVREANLERNGRISVISKT